MTYLRHRLPAQRLSSVRLRPRGTRPCTTLRASRVGTVQAPSVVKVGWLKTKIAEPTTKILDASWYLPTARRDPLQEYKQGHIPGAQFFDVDGVSDKSSSLPHMLPSETGFAAAMDALEIESSDHVIVYDGMGLFSAGRAWWMFKVFGHRDVSVLDGGFPAWKAAGLETETGMDLTDAEILKASRACAEAQEGKTSYPAKLDKKQVRGLDRMLQLIKTKEEQILDARPAGRFHGTAPEPREDGYLKTKDEILAILKDAGVDMSRDVVCSCGTGVTASAVALALNYVGFDKHVAIYDGSWSEWGARSDTPVELSLLADILTRLELTDVSDSLAFRAQP